MTIISYEGSTPFPRGMKSKSTLFTSRGNTAPGIMKFRGTKKNKVFFSLTKKIIPRHFFLLEKFT